MKSKKVWTLQEEYIFIMKILKDFGYQFFFQNKKESQKLKVRRRLKGGYFTFLT